MKKIAFALVALLVALSPLAAGESWVGVTTGPAFEIQVTDEIKEMATSTTVTDFNWDINLEGAYYFDEAETIGIGARLGVGIYYGSTFEIKDEVLMSYASMVPGLETMLGQLAASDPAAAQAAIASIVDSASYKSITGGTKIAPAITFQYRLALADNLDLRLGAGLQYIHTFGNGMKATVEIPGMGTKEFELAKISMDNLEVIANADVAYSFGSFQVFGGIDLGVTVMCYQTTETNGVKHGEFLTDGFQMSITPRVGVSYAF